MTRYLLALALLVPAVAVCSSPDPENSTVSKVLRSGEILYEYTRTDEPGGSIRLEVFMAASVHDLWNILAGCGEAFVFVDGLEQCEVIEKTRERALIHQVTDPGILVPVQDYTYESKLQPFERMDFNMVSGTMKAIDGSWQFAEAEGGVVVTYNLHVQPSLPVPRWLVRRSLRNNMRDMLACIRGLVDGSGSPKERDSDLGLCPGVVSYPD